MRPTTKNIIGLRCDGHSTRHVAKVLGVSERVVVSEFTKFAMKRAKWKRARVGT
jgi:hypothetical protein